MIFFAPVIYGQENIVPNPSFEDTVYCPDGMDRVNACKYWRNFGMSPDYFNACNPFLGPPNNAEIGIQYARTGNAMVGVCTFHDSASLETANYREFIGVELLQELLVGQKYYISLFANLAEYNDLIIASNKLGCRFSTVPFDSCCPPPTNNTAHLYTDLIVSDCINWVFISGYIIADSSYKYLIIGNFFDDYHTDTLNLSNIKIAAYYFIDDVCVSNDPEICNVAHSDNPIDEGVLVFPNPSDNDLMIKILDFAENLEHLDLFDVSGRLVGVPFFHVIMGEYNKYTIDLESFASGTYILRITTDQRAISRKIIHINSKLNKI